MKKPDLITELIKAGRDKLLKNIRDGLTEWTSIEEAHPEDRIICERIDNYFNSK